MASRVHLTVAMVRSWLLGLMLVGGGAAFALACSAPPSNQTPILVCTAGENGCPAAQPANPPKQNPAPAAPNEDDEEAEGLEPKQLLDAGLDVEAEAELGKICTSLKACCGQLQRAGYATTTCEEIVRTKSESACSLQYKSYRDFGDCS